MRYTYEDTAQLSHVDIEDIISRSETYARELMGSEGRHPDLIRSGIAAAREGMHAEIASRAAEELGSVRHVILMGIGGSSAGAEAVYGALKGPMMPELHVLDIVDDARFLAIERAIRGVPVEELAILVISKSGATVETITNASVFLERMSAIYGEAILARTIAIGDEGTSFAAAMREICFRFIPMPQEIGGRFSVFSVVGLVPLSLLGIDVRAFVSGAERALWGDVGSDRALRAAAVHYLSRNDGAHTHLLFAQESRVEALLTWCAQLSAESLGREVTKSESAFAGSLAPYLMTPRHLHSTVQLYLSGFKGVLTTFCGSIEEMNVGEVGKEGIGSLLSMAAPREYGRVSKAILTGVREAFKTRELPYAVHEFQEITPETLGGFMAERILETLYTAHLFDVEPFGQPHVELYKEKTHAALTGESL